MEEKENPLYLEVFRQVANSVEQLPKESVRHITEVMTTLVAFHEKLPVERKSE